MEGDPITITERPTLESEIADLTRRVAALEAAPKSTGDADLADLKKRLEVAGLVRDPVPEPKTEEKE
jgi:hypothetical protein